METLRNLFITVGLLLIFSMTYCSSSSKTIKDIAGRYAFEGENEFDYFKDTIEIRPTDDGKFDVQTIANWSAAKKDDPERPVNKKAGVWTNYGAGKIKVATLQVSDMTLRITDPLSGEVRIMTINRYKKSIEITSKNGTKRVYHKVS